MIEELSECVARVAAGDGDALGHLYDRTCRLVYGLALRILRRPDEAEEVVVDVYTQVWTRAASFDPDRGTVEAWLATITRSRALDRRRACATRPDLDSARRISIRDVAEEHQPGDLVVAFEARRRVNAMLTALTRSERHLIELAFYEGYTHRELAVLLDLPLGTVKSRIRSSLQKMREALEPIAGRRPIERARFFDVQCNSRAS